MPHGRARLRVIPAAYAADSLLSVRKMLIVQSAASAAAVSAAQERSSKAAARRTSIGRVQAQLPKSACMSTPLRQAPFRHAGVASRSQHRAAGDAWAGYKGVSRKSAKVSNSASPGAATAADPSPGLIGSFRAKLAEKVAADPNFIFKLFVEVWILSFSIRLQTLPPQFANSCVEPPAMHADPNRRVDHDHCQCAHARQPVLVERRRVGAGKKHNAQRKTSESHLSYCTSRPERRRVSRRRHAVDCCSIK